MAQKPKSSAANGGKPWHQPGKWLANPAYWDDESLQARAGMPQSIKFIDCTISEGDDCVGHQLNWNTRLGVIERLDAIGGTASHLCQRSLHCPLPDGTRDIVVRRQLPPKMGTVLAGCRFPHWTSSERVRCRCGADDRDPGRLRLRHMPDAVTAATGRAGPEATT